MASAAARSALLVNGKEIKLASPPGAWRRRGERTGPAESGATRGPAEHALCVRDPPDLIFYGKKSTPTGDTCAGFVQARYGKTRVILLLGIIQS